MGLLNTIRTKQVEMNTHLTKCQETKDRSSALENSDYILEAKPSFCDYGLAIPYLSWKVENPREWLKVPQIVFF